MNYSVFEGGDKVTVEDFKSRMRLLLAGLIEMNIPLNGGSETRRSVREFYEAEYGRFPGVEVVTSGCSVTVRKKKVLP